MLDEVIEQLRSTGGDPRRLVIADWAASKARMNLKILTAAYHVSSDPLLRQLAVDADTYQRNDRRVPTEAVEPHEEYLTDSVNAYSLGDRMRSLDYLNKALRHYPDWKRNPVIADYAATLMGISPAEAVRMLGEPDSELAFSVSKGARWWQERAMADSNINRRTLSLRLIAFALITAVATGALAYIIIDFWLPAAARPVASLLNDPSTVTLFMDAPRFANSVAVMVAVVAAVIYTVELLARTYLLHLLSGASDGRGDVRALLYRSINFQTVFIVGVCAVASALLLLSADRLAVTTGTGETAELVALSSRFYALGVGALVSYVVLMTRVLTETYRLSIGGGCAQLFIGTVIVWIATAVIFGVLQGLLRVAG